MHSPNIAFSMSDSDTDASVVEPSQILVFGKVYTLKSGGLVNVAGVIIAPIDVVHNFGWTIV